MVRIKQQAFFGAIICLLAYLSLYKYANAEVVSILNTGSETEGLLVEAAMKRHLRAEGFTVKGGTTDGYLLVVSVMPSLTVGGQKRGVIGSIMVSSLSWQAYGDSLISEQCKTDQELVQRIKDVVGVRIIYINSTMAQAPNEESLAEMLSTFANREIRATSKKVGEFFDAVSRKMDRENYSPTVNQVR